MMAAEIDYIVEPVLLVTVVNSEAIYAATAVTTDRDRVTVFAKVPAGERPPSVKDRAQWRVNLSRPARDSTPGEDA